MVTAPMAQRARRAKSSPQLQEANRRLQQLRTQLQAQRLAKSVPRQEEKPAPAAVDQAGRKFDSLPSHLGWGSENLTQAMRQAHRQRAERHRRTDAKKLQWLPSGTPAYPHTQSPHGDANPSPAHCEPSAIKLYPDLALAMLRQEQEAAGRVWLLLHHLDEDGCGWVTIKHAREVLAKKESKLHVCGWRQLRNLLHAGEGAFWKRDENRIWLRSTAKVAAVLGVQRLSGQPVALPVEALCSGIGEVRAHFYASFHSGRAKADGKAQSAAPIARATLEEITGVPPRTQIEYEERANVEVESNYVIGERATTENLQERAWQHGRAAFTFTDRKGKQGRKGETYVAWQLPNSYAGPHQQRPRGRQRRLNQELADLRNQGGAGNGQRQVRENGRFVRRYYPNGGAAGRAYERGATEGIYWCGGLGLSRSRLWYLLCG